eukprot:828664-Pyramimonas_sp.AAC.1
MSRLPSRPHSAKCERMHASERRSLQGGSPTLSLLNHGSRRATPRNLHAKSITRSPRTWNKPFSSPGALGRPDRSFHNKERSCSIGRPG